MCFLIQLNQPHKFQAPNSFQSSLYLPSAPHGMWRKYFLIPTFFPSPPNGRWLNIKLVNPDNAHSEDIPLYY